LFNVVFVIQQALEHLAMCLASMRGYTWIIATILIVQLQHEFWIVPYPVIDMFPMHIVDEAFILVVVFWVKYIPWIYSTSLQYRRPRRAGNDRRAKSILQNVDLAGP